MMNYAREYHTYLRLERSYSPNTIASYELDLQKMFAYFEGNGIDPIGAQLADLQAFLYDTFRENAVSSQVFAHTIVSCSTTTMSMPTPPNCWRDPSARCTCPWC